MNKKTISTFELLSIGETARMLRVHPNTLRNWDEDGTLKPIRISNRKVRRYRKEDIKGLLSLQKENGIMESGEFNKTLLATLPFGIDIVDEKGNVLFMNKRFLSIFGDKSLGKKCWILYKDDKKQCANCPLKKVVKIGKTAVIESEGCMGGKTLLISHTGMKYNGKPAIMEVFTDITDRKELDHRKDEFISIASHELRTPLTSIKVYGQILQNLIEKGNTEKLLDMTIKMNKQFAVLENSVNDLLDVNRIKIGKLVLRKQQFDILDFLKEECLVVQETLSKHKLVIYSRHQKIKADKERMRQVLINLFTNAAKYSPNAKKIIIRTKKKDNKLLVSVKDYGVGIPKDQQEKIFQRFFQVEKLNNKLRGGLGLGLFIAKGIVEQHRGNIWVESEEGEGSTFYFTLPIK